MKIHLRSRLAYPLAAALGSVLLCASAAWSRTETVVWNFSNSNGDGAKPFSNSLISDGKGNLFGATAGGGSSNCVSGCGVVFELSPNGSGGYNETILHDFTGTNGDGEYPPGSLVFDPQGNLYGTTIAGGTNGTGTVYELSPNSGGGWTETILYSFGAAGSARILNTRQSEVTKQGEDGRLPHFLRPEKEGVPTVPG